MFKDAKDYDMSLVGYTIRRPMKQVHSVDTRAKIGKANTKIFFEGKSTKEWANIKGISIQRIHTLLKQYGTVHVSDQRKLALNSRTRLHQGKTFKVWSKELGVSTAVIHYRVNTHGSVYGKKKETA